MIEFLHSTMLTLHVILDMSGVHRVNTIIMVMMGLRNKMSGWRQMNDDGVKI